MKKSLKNIGAAIGFLVFFICFIGKADNQILLGGNTFAYGVNVVNCNFTSFDATGKISQTTRPMIITGDFMGNATGYLVNPADSEKDNLYFVSLLDGNNCSYDGNPDNIINLKGLGQFWSNSPFRNKGSSKVPCQGLLRTIYVPQKTSGMTHQAVMLLSNGSNQTVRTNIIFDQDTALGRTIIHNDGNWQIFKTCANFVVNMDYIDMSTFITQDGKTPIDDEIVIFNERDIPPQGWHNDKYGNGFQYATMSGGALSSYFQILGLQGHNLSPWDRWAFPSDGVNDYHVLQGGMIGLSPDGNMSYIFTVSKSNLNMNVPGFTWMCYMSPALYTYSCKIYQDQKGNLNVGFGNRMQSADTHGYMKNKDFGRVWNTYSSLLYTEGGPSLNVFSDNTAGFDIGSIEKYGALDTCYYVTPRTGTAVNYSYSPSEQNENSLVPTSIENAKTDVIKDFLGQNGKIKIVFYGMPYALNITSKILPNLAFNLTNYSSTVRDTSNGVSVDAEMGGSFGVDKVSESSLGVIGGYSKTWGHKDAVSTTEAYKLPSTPDRNDYNNTGMLICVKGNGFVSGYVDLKTTDKNDPILMTGSVLNRIPFRTYYAQPNPGQFQLSSELYTLADPSSNPLAEGLGGRGFGNLYDGSQDIWNSMAQWEQTQSRLPDYIKLSNLGNSGISLIKSYDYAINSSYTVNFSVDRSSTDYTSSSWYAGLHFKTANKAPGFGFYCDVKSSYKSTDNFSATSGQTNGFTFNYTIQDMNNRQHFTLFVMNINIPSLKAYLANQSNLPKEKPFFVPQLNWDSNEDFVLVISETNPHITAE
jgi:hypothetical protein